MSVKGLQEDGSFEGILASYNTVDLGGDKILPGAFTKTMQERGSQVPMLWQHDPHQPIGTLNLSDSQTGLMVKGQLLMDLPQAKVAYTLLKAKAIKGLSIGYDTVKDSIENGVRQLKEVRLWEGSVVTFPMNEACMITAVKKQTAGAGETKDDFNSELAGLQLQEAGYQMISALSYATYSVAWATDLDRADRIDAIKTILEQFSSAFSEFFPKFIDWQMGASSDVEMMGRMKVDHKEFNAVLSRGAKTITALHRLTSEAKEGRELSGKNVKALRGMHDKVKALDTDFCTLLDAEADAADEPGPSATLKSTAVTETKTEPVEDHSAAAEILTGLRSLFSQA